MKARVLVIDDDRQHREILAEALAYYHFKVRTLSSGRDLKRVLMNFRPALLLMDYRLPGQNGVELCRIIKKEFHMNEVPVILMSAYPLDTENLNYCDYILHKPFDLDMLIDHVKDLLKARRSASPSGTDQDQPFE